MQFNNTENYITTEDLEMAVNAAINLEKPLLIKGLSLIHISEPTRPY